VKAANTGEKARMVWQPANQLEKERLEKLERLATRGIDPFPGKVRRTHSTTEALAAFEAHPDANTIVTVCGRFKSIRVSGKASFAHIEDGAGRLQLFVKVDEVGEEAYEVFKKDYDLGDFVQATGPLMKTKTGEISVQVKEFVLLAKALSPLPVIKEREIDGKIERFSEFTDMEERYRQRYADLASNSEIREIFRKRAKTISAVRRFFDEEGFLEVETPILQPVYGGAAARPFITHHNQLDQDLYLRISFELYLKRLLVGGYDAVYELGRDFRNEGVSFKHNPEFTMLEWYIAYNDYHDNMARTERLLAFVANEVNGSTKVHFRGHDIELGGKWRRVTMRDVIKEGTGIDYVDYPTAEALEAVMRKHSDKEIRDVKPGQSWGKLVEHLLGSIEHTFIQPIFIINYPRDISPFAKAVPGDPMHVERFEFYIGGMEFGNAFTELNDPRDQEQRFLDMAALYGDQDDDQTPLDEDYLRAMRYGMPPNSGEGIGIDRLVMLVTGRDVLREILLYPHLKKTEEERT
jgi:lysyl-tRNA synthetase class 2